MEVTTTQNGVDLELLKPILAEYAKVSGSLITILQKTQAIYGYLPISALTEIAAATGVAPAKIMGVATFYTQFRLEPIGKYLIMVCQGTACHVNGSEKLAQALSDELGIQDGETSKDGLFTLKHVACLGCCSLAPAIMINDDVYGNLTGDKARKIVQDIAKKTKEAAK
ncbi:MAG: NADH-quinone oxidoreductase subunit NuoE [Clostridia bacterium]|jgi:NADH-quinone oxidoreductase subunit E|nr:NADH-quinone oxidoreductase subunit NuoE [Clostridia bacterium]MDD4571858.1 NADH-quinone oxidoreductase subunit NuoE [Clostridia bacterium]